MASTVKIVAEPTCKRGCWLVSILGSRGGSSFYRPKSKREAERIVRKNAGSWIRLGYPVEIAIYGTDGRLTAAAEYQPEKSGRVVKIDRTEHVRKRHERSGFTRVNPRTGKRVKVPATTVKHALIPRAVFTVTDVGTPGKQSRGAEGGPHAQEKPWITREGKLGEGFLTELSLEDEKAVLDACVSKHKYRSCLGSILVLERSKPLRKKYGGKLAKLREYLKGKYGGPGSFGPRKKKRK